MDTSTRLEADRAELYQRIMNFEIDDAPTTFSFAHRLARENGWSLAFSHDVVREYKRFIFLMVHAGHPVTPSDQVDQAWHLHLTYTQSYWDRLCAEVVGRRLHHIPTLGGAAEARKYDEWYRRTLSTYRRIYGEPPRPDIWPNPRMRFGEDRFQRVNIQRNFVIPRMWTGPRPRRIKEIFLAAFITVGVVAATPLNARTSGDAPTDGATVMYLLWLAVLFIMLLQIVKDRYRLRCRHCKNFDALKPTGITAVREKKMWEEYRCNNCHFADWRVSHRNNANGAGCGGVGDGEGGGADASCGGGCGGGCGG